MTRLPRRPMSADEIAMARALGRCRVLPATFDKRFIATAAACAEDDEPAVTEKQAQMIRRLVHKYRRQIAAVVVALAGEPLPPAWSAPATPAPAPSRRTSAPTPQLSLL